MNMRMIVLAVVSGTAMGVLAANAAGVEDAAQATAAADGTAITVYNQNFAVVRERLTFGLGAGETHVRFADTTVHLDPQSVILRDAEGKRKLGILEQNFRADAISEGLLLSLYEGKTIDFETYTGPQGTKSVVQGTIIRSGYTPHYAAFSRYGQQYAQSQMAYGGGGSASPVVKVNGQLIFGLPGKPVFPALTDDSILKPTLDWVIASDIPGPVTAELGYMTGGMSWLADYTIVAPAESAPGKSAAGERISLVGWVTIDNQSGKTFTNAKLKLMAGDVNKLQDGDEQLGYARREMMAKSDAGGAAVSERTFDDLHLYTINRATTLRDRETKQVELVKAENVAAKRMYVYDGAYIEPGMRGWDYSSIRNSKEYGSRSNPKVWIMREFKNSQANGLGVPLPKGKMRFYRQDAAELGGQLEFVGENVIDHTPKDELVRVYTGNAFDVVGERVQTNFETQHDREWLKETFVIKVRNHKAEPVEVRVVEHLYRWNQWEIQGPSQPFEKKDSQTIEFLVTVPPDGEKEVTYTAKYSW